MTWGAVAIGGATLIGGVLSSGAQQDAAQQQNQYTQQDQELNFQRQAWLAQQQREWQLQDRQFKQQSIAEFANYKGGKDQSGITPATQNNLMGTLDQFDPNKLGSVGAPLSQLAPPGATGAGLPGDPNHVMAGGGVY